MVYEFAITVPKDTPKNDPKIEEAVLPPQVITQVEVEMAAGCHRMVHCAVYEGNFKVFPRNQEGSIATDNNVLVFRTFFALKRGHNTLTIKCWSPDTEYSHKVTVRFVMMSRAAASILSLYNLTRKAFRRLGLVK